MANRLQPERTRARDLGRAKQRANQQLIERHRDEYDELLHAAKHAFGVSHIHAVEDHGHGEAS